MSTYRVSDQQYAEMREWVRNYINANCIVRDVNIPGKVPGTTYSWMFYLRRGLFNAMFSSAIAQMFLYKVEREIDPTFNIQLSGLETAATPMLSSIPIVWKAFGVNVNAFVVRKEQKEYGLKNWIEGYATDQPVLMIDDLCNSGSSLARCHQILSNMNADFIPYCLTIVNKSNKGVHSKQRLASDIYLPKNFKVISLFDLDDFDLTNPSH